MKDHILEFIQPGTKLSKKRGLLLAENREHKIEVPFADISGVLIVSTDILVSTAVIAELLEHGVCLQILNDKYMPQGLASPYVGHNSQRAKLLSQISLSTAQVNRFWQKIIESKILNQSLVLEQAGFDGTHLRKLANEVESGDHKNTEAQAARHYWPRIFGEGFTRDVNAYGPNSFLNYGYSIIRSAVARYLVATGLNPSLGLFHSNLQNPFCLVDDLMEPFRPLIDLYCLDFLGENELSSEIRKKMVSALEHPVVYKDEKKPLRNAIIAYCQVFSKAVAVGDFKMFDVEFEMFSGTSKRL